MACGPAKEYPAEGSQKQLGFNKTSHKERKKNRKEEFTKSRQLETYYKGDKQKIWCWARGSFAVKRGETFLEQ